jgi:hypothetical protein
MSTTGNETRTLVAPASPSQKKWYEDDPVLVEEQQSQFSRAGVGFDAIQVKTQDLYEIGVLKLFIESEIMKSNSGAFEPGFKELYKDLLFTSDIEFSETGFVSGSLENDKKKIFLNRSEFTNYLLRLPKPISDTVTPLDEKQDMNAYKYLQVIGTELQDKILFLCDRFIQEYNQQYRQNANDISRIQKEVSDLKRLTGPGVNAGDIQNRITEKEKELVKAKNIKIQLETKRVNYKNACTLLSNSTRRSQYNASLVAAYPALKNDASSYSTVMLDWFKFKHNGSNFFKQVCGMYKPIIPNNMLTTRQKILISLQEVATKIGNIFRPMFESYFFNELTTNVRRYMRIIPNNTYSSYLFELSNEVTRRSDSSKFSWLNINAMFSKIIKETQFANNFDKIRLERLQSVSQLMANFSSEILTFFSLFKFEKSMNIFNSKPNDNKNVYERAEQDDDFFKRAENINMLFQNVYYLKKILEMISNELNRVGGLVGLTAQQTTLVRQLQSQLNDIIPTIVNILFPTLNIYKINVQRYDYETLLGEASHSGFVENIFSGKVAFISHFHKNNKFLVSSEYIQNSPVTITIPDGKYTLETLASVIESELCNSCKWSRQRQANYDDEMLWRCKYDNKNFLQLGLYFPIDNMNNYPNILWYSFIISSTLNTGARQYTLYIPKGEYKNIRQVLDAMQSTINDFIGKSNEYVIQFQSIFTITLELNPATNTECVKFALKKKTPSDPNEDLTIILNAPLAQLLSKNNTPGFIPVNINVELNNNINNPIHIQVNNIFANSEKILTNPPSKLQLSKTITIDTATMIDGERYDASDIFGIRRQANQAIESLQLYPDIVTNFLYISSDYYKGSRICHNQSAIFQSCIFLSIILNSQLELAGPAPANVMYNNLNDFGRLNFTSKRINDDVTFIPVNMKEIEKKANASVAVEVQNGFKSDILEKTGIYMSNRLLHPKVPVITPVDILNSILYRYPCIPSSHVKRALKEGSPEFDEFIERRVNIPECNAVICLGKGEKGQMPSFTFKNILKKSLMYDESDDRRNKLFCDLHYALCGPVYVNVNPSQEINQLTILDEFSFEMNRPMVSMPGVRPPTYSSRRPFSVKGITPFYDYEKEYYKYLIYGEYTIKSDGGDSYTLGCVKYYDPGSKIGPGHDLNASELYDVIVTLNDNFVSSTIHKMIWLPSDQEHRVDRFIIIGEFERITYFNKYKTIIENKDYSADGIQKYRIWSFAHTYPTPTSPPNPSYFSVNPEIESTSYRRLDRRIRDVLTFDAFYYIFNVVITINDQGEAFIFIPYTNTGVVLPNPVPNDRDSAGRDVYYKPSCSAISMNKSLQNICKSHRFYRIMENKYPNPANPAINAYATSKVANSQIEYNYLQGRNPDSRNHLLWLGLKEQTIVRKILSCKRIDRATLSTYDLVLPITFEDGDSIENIRVDINNPEIVTVFGKFKATISDRLDVKPKKVIQNVMVIYTNLQNAEQNDSTYGNPASYSLGYDNFKGISINENEEFVSFYSCIDGLVPASIDKGTMQQNFGILTVKKMETSEPVVIGFHNAALSTMSDKSTVKEGAIHVPFTLCYDYNMCADSLKIVYDEFARPPVPPETKIEKSVFNPMTFYTSYMDREEGSNNHFCKGVYALVHAKNPFQFFSSPSNVHVLNTWGIDLSSNETLFYKRLYEASRTNTTVFQFNIKTYEKYMNDIVDTILGSAKAYYEDKIKSTFYTYGTIDGKPPIVFKRDGGTNRNIIVGGGKEEDAKQMLLATEYVVNEDAQKSDLKNRKNVIRKKIVEIRIPDIMLSDYYTGVLTESNRKNVRMIFVNSVFNYSKQLVDITIKQNEEVKKNKGADNNVIILDDYHVVLCSKNETIRNRFNELKALDTYVSADYLTLSGDVFDFELPSSSNQGDKQVIVVNEWNDKGCIGDYGAYAYSDAAATGSLTPNQMMVSKSRQLITEATAEKEATTKSVPKYPNTAFLLNPFFSYYTLDPSKWTGIPSLKAGESSGRRGQLGGAPPLYPRSNYGIPDPYFLQGQRQLQAPFGAFNTFNPPYEQGYGYGYGQPRNYYGQGQIDNGDEVIRMKRKVLESTDVPSKNLKKINIQTMQTDTRFKKIVLWLFDSRENKMLMVKTLIGNKVVLSIPVQNQQVGAIRASGYSLLQQLCRRLFNQSDIIQKWTLEVSYAYNDDANTDTIGIFIYSAKSYDLPRPTLELIYVNMQAVLNLTKGSMIVKKGSQQTDESQLEINSRDVALVGEVFRVVPLIQGGIISSTSKEFNQIVANLVSKMSHQHVRSSISEKKRGENVEKNIQFLINLFFSQNSIFFLRGQLKYYIYSSQRSCKIFTIVKQPGYDDDSYLTCLKLFLQSEYDYKQKLSTFRVGCSMKKKLIADNFTNVWDSFWNDLIESQEQVKGAKQIESEIGSMETGEGEEGEGEAVDQQIKEVSKEDGVSAPVCLKGALPTCKKMYDVQEDWNASSYYPLAYDGVSYTLDPNENPYGFNNEYYYNLDNLQISGDNTFYGFKCMKYNGDAKNPILYLGGKINYRGSIKSALYEMLLITKKLKPILIADNVDSEFLCIDMVGMKHVMIGGKGFNNVIKYVDDPDITPTPTPTIIPLVIMNIETYDVTVLYDNNPRVAVPIIVDRTDDTSITKVCICKNRRVIDKTQKTSYYEYVGLFGGDIKIETAGAGADPNIVNLGCVVIRVPIDDSNPNFQLSARMYCIDSKVQNGVGTVADIIPGLRLNSLSRDQTVSVTSIICSEEENDEKGKEDGGASASADADANVSNKTTFYVGGYFNAFSYMDHVGLQQAEAAVIPGGPRVDENLFIKRGMCNSILKLTIITNYNTAETDYRHKCVFQPIETNANKNNIIFNASLALYKKDSSSQPFLLAFTAFVDQTTNPATININTRTITTTLNAFDLKTKLNTQVMIPVPNSLVTGRMPPIIKSQYEYQCIAVVQDAFSKKYIAVMSYTMRNGANRYAYSFTCELNMEAPFKVIESKCNDEAVTSHHNSVTDICGIENRNGNQIDVYVAHENIGIEADRPEDQILYPLTVKSNYQQIGNWNLGFINGESESESEIKIFCRFIDSIMELNKIFKEYPSLMLFLQNIDYREKNQKITSSVLQKMYYDLQTKTTLDDAAGNIVEPKIIDLQYMCNKISFNLIIMLQVWNVATTATSHFNNNSNSNLFNQIKYFYDSLIFLLIYSGCINLAQNLCDNYVNLVLSDANNGEGDVLTQENWKEKFLKTFSTFDTTTSTLKTFFNEKTAFLDQVRLNQDIVICSNPETYTGVAYMKCRIDKNLETLTSDTKQKALHNKIYKSNETFFDANNDFFTTNLASDSINTIDEINFCSFYKFQRLKMDNTPFRTNFGGMIGTTIYAAVNIDSNKNFESSKVFEFLRLIIAYFKRLPSGAPVIETGIGGPIQRVVFGGNFGCNLLHDAQVCAQFAKNGMKIYTRPNNSNAFTSVTNSSGNHMFVVDVNVMSVSSSLSGGGREKVKKRLTIGEVIQTNQDNIKEQQQQNRMLVIVNHKKKTKRRYIN